MGGVRIYPGSCGKSNRQGGSRASRWVPATVLRSLAAQTMMGEDLASVHLAAMADPDDQHKKPLVLNFAKEAIVPDAEAPKLCQFALQ